MFNIARLPRAVCDIFSTHPSPIEPAARTILLTARDWFYTIDVLEDDGAPVPPKVLEARIAEVVVDAGERLKNGQQAVPISVLSADDRDIWAKVHTTIILTSNYC